MQINFFHFPAKKYFLGRKPYLSEKMLQIYLHLRSNFSTISALKFWVGFKGPKTLGTEQ